MLYICSAQPLWFPSCVVMVVVMVFSSLGSSVAVGSSPLMDGCPTTTPSTRLLTFGLVADAHYDTFPAGEKAPWEPMQHWLQEQGQRTSNHNKRRYDVAKDKMEEAIEVFNKLYLLEGSSSRSSQGGNSDREWPPELRLGRGGDTTDTAVVTAGARMDLVVNLGDLINNDPMWNLKPVLDVFNRALPAHYHLLGNHDLRAHNDRFGKVNISQHRWIQHKMLNNLPIDDGGSSSSLPQQQQPGWHFSVRYPPFFRLIFIDSMVMEPETADKRKRDDHLDWLRRELQAANDTGTDVVVLFAHIPIGVQTNIMGPTIRAFDSIIIAAFFGHNHKGGYIQQGNIHSITINGQIETLVNAFAVAEVYPDRLELTGFGRVPSRILKFTSSEALRRLTGDPFLKLVRRAQQSGDIARGGVSRRDLTSYTEVTVKQPSSGAVESTIVTKRVPLNCWWDGGAKKGHGDSSEGSSSSAADGDSRRRPDLRRIPAEPQGLSGSGGIGDGGEGAAVAAKEEDTISSSQSVARRHLYQPLPPPDVWRGVAEGKEPPLQKPPPLQLSIPLYKKPLLPYVDPNPGGTSLLLDVVSKHDWKTRRRRVQVAQEDPVQLNDAVVKNSKDVAAIHLVRNVPVNGKQLSSEHNAVDSPLASSVQKSLAQNVKLDTNDVKKATGSSALLVPSSTRKQRGEENTDGVVEDPLVAEKVGNSGGSDDGGSELLMFGGWWMVVPCGVSMGAAAVLCGWRSCLRRKSRRGQQRYEENTVKV